LFDGFFNALISGCSSIPLQSEELVESKAEEFLHPQELIKISLNTQREFQCGPVALAATLYDCPFIGLNLNQPYSQHRALQWHSGG
jgi:hypothetical protein